MSKWFLPGSLTTKKLKTFAGRKEIGESLVGTKIEQLDLLDFSKNRKPRIKKRSRRLPDKTKNWTTKTASQKTRARRIDFNTREVRTFFILFFILIWRFYQSSLVEIQFFRTCHMFFCICHIFFRICHVCFETVVVYYFFLTWYFFFDFLLYYLL